MKTATGLAIVAVGAILAFAVTGHPGWLNVQAAGWVLILVGLAGMFVPRRGYGWLRRRVVRRPAMSRTGAAVPRRRRGHAQRHRPAGRHGRAHAGAGAGGGGGALADDPEVFPGRQLSKAEVEEQVTASPLSSTSETIEEYLEE